jgi:hypothetical protein
MHTLLLLPMLALATASWPANPEPNIAGYVVYHSDFAQAPFLTITNVGNHTNYTFPVTEGATYRVGVSAYNTFGIESHITNWVNWTCPTNLPSTLELITETAPQPKGPYSPLFTNRIEATNKSGIFRLLIRARK